MGQVGIIGRRILDGAAVPALVRDSLKCSTVECRANATLSTAQSMCNFQASYKIVVRITASFRKIGVIVGRGCYNRPESGESGPIQSRGALVGDRAFHSPIKAEK